MKWQADTLEEIDIGRLYRLLGTADALAAVTLDVRLEARDAEHALLERVEALAVAVLDALGTSRSNELGALLLPEGVDVFEGQPEDATPWLGVIRALRK
jgi:hypothetical protein